MKKTLLVLISIIAALALVGCNAETSAPDTEDSTTAHSGAEVITRAIALLQEYDNPDDNELSVTTDSTVNEDKVNSNPGLTLGDVIKAGSTASISYNGNSQEVMASASIAVTLDEVDYTVNGDIIYSIDASSNLSGVVSKSVSIKDANENEATITDSELISAMAPFKDIITHLIESWVDFVVPNWVPTGPYKGEGNTGGNAFMNDATMEIDQDGFVIDLSSIKISSSDNGVTLIECVDNNPTWNITLRGIPIVPGNDVEVAISVENGENLSVSVNVGGAMSFNDIKFVPNPKA